MEEINREAFLDHLHDALNHLYNADYLRNSPLSQMMGTAHRFDSSSTLRKMLTEAIDALKPTDDEPDGSRGWRTYESLYCCFVQQLNQQVVADQLCISPRQLRREQRAALETLADLLWQKYSPQASAAPVQDGAAGKPPLIGDLEWLKDHQSNRPSRLEEELQGALLILQPLTERNLVSVRQDFTAGLPGVALHPAMLNQVLVSLLSSAIQHIVDGAIHLAVALHPHTLELKVTLEGAPSPANDLKECTANLDVAAELCRLGGGGLSWSNAGRTSFTARLVLPTLEQLPVLVIDDNEDTLELFKRYTAGTRYHIIATSDTTQIFEMVEHYSPHIIILDIMMPRENGWMVLGKLRQHPRTTNIPVIICSILPQENLALSLGAAAFVRKQVNRQDFLQALDQQYALMQSELN